MPHRNDIVFGWPAYALRRVLRYYAPFLVLWLALLLLMVFGREWIERAVGVRAWHVRAAFWALVISSACVHIYLLYRSRAAGPEVPASRLACPRCGHPMEDLDPDTVMCMECGTKGEYRAVKRAWRRVGPLYRPKQARG